MFTHEHCSHSVAAASKCAVFSSQTKWKLDVTIIVFSTLFTWHRFYLTTLIPWLFFSLIRNYLSNQFERVFFSFRFFFCLIFGCSSKSLIFAIFFRWNSIFQALFFPLYFLKIWIFWKSTNSSHFFRFNHCRIKRKRTEKSKRNITYRLCSCPFVDIFWGGRLGIGYDALCPLYIGQFPLDTWFSFIFVVVQHTQHWRRYKDKEKKKNKSKLGIDDKIKLKVI